MGRVLRHGRTLSYCTVTVLQEWAGRDACHCLEKNTRENIHTAGRLLTRKEQLYRSEESS